MSILQVLTYAAGLVFIVALVSKILKYWFMPMHVRWELYPIPHEGKPWGGSFYEELDHWKKERHTDHVSQYSFMIPEILFIRALYEDNRPLWYWSFPFHFGLYTAIGGLVFLVIGALLQIGGLQPGASALATLVQSLTVLLGVVGFILGTIGALGLIFKRLTDPMLKDYTVPIDFMNLAWLAAIFVTGFIVWMTDPGFAGSRQFLVSAITFGKAPSVSAIQAVNLLLFLGFIAYFPFTHMTHMISKYFMWDKVKWDDKWVDAAMDSKIRRYLGYPVTWAASHVGAEGGKKTWAEVATSNPWEPKEDKGEKSE